MRCKHKVKSGFLLARTEVESVFGARIPAEVVVTDPGSLIWKQYNATSKVAFISNCDGHFKKPCRNTQLTNSWAQGSIFAWELALPSHDYKRIEKYHSPHL